MLILFFKGEYITLFKCFIYFSTSCTQKKEGNVTIKKRKKIKTYDLSWRKVNICL